MKREDNKNNSIYDCIVIGAGAAGLFYAAGDCLKESSNARSVPDYSARKLILEKTSRPGQKLLMSGNSMCNITHGGSIKDFIDKYGDNGRLIRKCLYAHNNLELMKTMESIGVPLTERADGKVFPVSMRAKDVLDALLDTISSCRNDAWQIECSADVSEIKIQNPIIQVVLRDGRSFMANKLVIATGGSSYPSTGSDGSFFNVLQRDLGLKIAKPRPALAPVFVHDFSYSDLAGISFDDVTVTCNDVASCHPQHVTHGGLLITHRGLSGPAILHISQYVRPGSAIRIDFLPGTNAEEMTNALKTARVKSGQSIANYLASEFGLPKAFAAKQFEIADSNTIIAHKKLADLSNKDIRAIISLFKEYEYNVSGTGGWNDAMVTAGGVCLDQIDLKTMRVKIEEANDSCHPLPDIRIIGEALDINGDTGGYNLQFAYSSAMAALASA